MRSEQKVIARWIERTQHEIGISYDAWAAKAKIGAATTITRAVKDDYTSVTSVPTLVALAKAANRPSVLDFLANQTGGGASTQSLPSEEALERLLAAVLPLARRGAGAAQSTRVVAAALQRGLELLGEQSANPTPDSLGVAARGAVARFRDLLQQ